MMDHQKRFIVSFLHYAGQRGVAPERLCKLSGIDMALLIHTGEGHITHKQVNDLWINACYLTNDFTFGLHFGEAMRLSALGIVGEIIQNSRTMGDAIIKAAEYLSLVTDLFHLEVHRRNKRIKIKFVPNAHCLKNYPFALEQGLDLSMVFTLNELNGLVLKQLIPLSVKLKYTSLRNPQEYERILRCMPTLKAREYAMEFDACYWHEQIVAANYELQSLLLGKAGEMLSNNKMLLTIKAKIENYLLANSYLGVPTLEEVAANFNTSPRSLQRKLQEENTSFQKIADGIRKSLALHYIQSGHHPIKEISYMLGYNEISAFTRAFKRWTGATPAGYMKDN